MTPDASKIWIITGPCQVGKTRFCSFLVEQAKNQGLDIAGVLCPPIYENQQKTTITIINFKTQECKILAKVRTSENEGVYTDHWVFDEEVLSWGNQVLAETKNCDLLLVDELGPLEFNRGQGWQNGLQAIDQGDFQITAVVIRPSLVQTAVHRWPNAQVLEIPTGLVLEETKILIEKILHSN